MRPQVRARLDADPPERCVDAERSQLGILLELPDLRDGLESYLADVGVRSAAPVLQPRRSLCSPSLEHVVHRVPVHAHVPRDTLDVTPLHVERDEGVPVIVRVGDAVIRLVAPPLALGHRTLG